jgi:Tfp pilus assembly protein PilN
MKSINFIKPIPPKRQQAFAFWLYASLFILIALAITLAYFYINHLSLQAQINSDLEELKKTTASFDTYVTQKKQLQQEKTLLEDRLIKVRACTNNAPTPQELLAQLAQITPPSLCLSTLQGTLGGKIIVEGTTHNAQAVTSFLNLLNNCSQLNDLSLTSLAPTEEKSPHGEKLMRFSISGVWKSTHQSFIDV